MGTLSSARRGPVRDTGPSNFSLSSILPWVLLAFGVLMIALGLITRFTGTTVLSATLDPGEDGTTFTTGEVRMVPGAYDIRISASGVRFVVDFGRVGFRIQSEADPEWSVRGLLKSSTMGSNSRRLRLRGTRFATWEGPETSAFVVTLDREIDEPIRLRMIKVARDHRMLEIPGLVLIAIGVLLSPQLRSLVGRLANRSK
jgi:hypothetical protein